MKITSNNVWEGVQSGEFFKATPQGVQKCLVVDNSPFLKDVGELPPTWGYVVDSLFVNLNQSTSMFHFDNPNQGFFTTEQEAIELHRELVLNYINGLNASSLKTCPIVTG